MKLQNKFSAALGIGDAMVDLFTRASQLPPHGGNIWSSAVEMHSGGTTANVSANLAKLGIPSAFAGSVGDDPYGNFLLDEFKRIGVDASRVHINKGTYTGIILAIIDDQGERTFVACARGAAHVNITPEYAEALKITTNELVHSSGVCLVEEPARSGLLAALRKAHREGHPLFFDPNLRLEGNYFPEPLREAQFSAMSIADVVLIGDEEVSLLYPGTSLETGVHHMLEAGTKLVVVKQGDKGACAFTANHSEQVPAFKVSVLSTAGAGDSFDAGFIAATTRQSSLHDALVYANAVAAIKVGRQGSQSVPSHEEVLTFLAARGPTR